MNFLHIPGQGLGMLLIRIVIKTEIRSFWVRTFNVQSSPRPPCYCSSPALSYSCTRGGKTQSESGATQQAPSISKHTVLSIRARRTLLHRCLAQLQSATGHSTVMSVPAGCSAATGTPLNYCFKSSRCVCSTSRHIHTFGRSLYRLHSKQMSGYGD